MEPVPAVALLHAVKAAQLAPGATVKTDDVVQNQEVRVFPYTRTCAGTRRSFGVRQ